MKRKREVGDVEVVAEIRKLDYGLEKPDQFAMDPSQISMVAYYRGLPGEGTPEPGNGGTAMLPKFNTKANGATYPLNYLLDFLKMAAKSGATHVSLASGKDLPLWACATIEVESNDENNKARTMEFALAPRISSGEGEIKGVMFRPDQPKKEVEVVKDDNGGSVGSNETNDVQELVRENDAVPAVAPNVQEGVHAVPENTSRSQ